MLAGLETPTSPLGEIVEGKAREGRKRKKSEKEEKKERDKREKLAAAASAAAMKKRRHSMSSLAVPSFSPLSPISPNEGRGLSPVRSNADLKDAAAADHIEDAEESIESHRADSLDMKERSAEGKSGRERRLPKLKFNDYIIKPIQRLCKYPLLLDAMLSSPPVRSPPPMSSSSSGCLVDRELSLPSGPDVVVASAAQAMRHVAALVDQSKHTYDQTVKATTILDRYTTTAPSLISFLKTAGPVAMAGSLGVVFGTGRRLSEMGSGLLNAKYLGAFLYEAGYLVLAKVSKGKYEPRHWFTLAGMTLDPLEGEEGAC